METETELLKPQTISENVLNATTASCYSLPSSTTDVNTIHYASSSTVEWYTPARYADAVRAVFGGQIELDPASCEEANAVIRAERYYTIADNGLAQPWNSSTTYLNPPYGRIHGKSQAGIWSRRLISEYTSGNVGEAILLVNASTSEAWFQPLFDYRICFTNHRIRFCGHDGEGCSPTKGSAFVYFGHDSERFSSVFSDLGIGRVVLPSPQLNRASSLFEEKER